MFEQCCRNAGVIFFSIIGIFGVHIALAHSYHGVCVPSLDELQSPIQLSKYLGTFASPICSGLIDLMKYTQNTYSMLIGAIFAILMGSTFNGTSNIYKKVN